MLLLEIGYSEKYDTFTGYVYSQSEYFCYEITRDKVNLSPIREEFQSCKHFADQFSKSNPHARFLTDPIAIKKLNYDELTRYKRLALTTSHDIHWINRVNLKKPLIAMAVVCLVAGLFLFVRQHYTQYFQQEIVIPSITTSDTDIIKVYYEIHLIGGGFIDGFDLKQNGEQVLVTNRKGLEVAVDLSSITSIEKIEVGNTLSRSLIYGSKL